MLKAYPRFATLKRRFQGVAGDKAAPWRRSAYRCVTLEWARSAYLITGQGTLKYGGRWMTRSITPVVYASSTEGIALKEARHNFTRYGIQPKQHPRVTVELDVQLQAVVPLADLLCTEPWPELRELLEEDWQAVNDMGQENLSQACGRALFELGFEALMVPSSRDARGNNLVMFPANLRAESKIGIVGQHDLDTWLVE